METENDQIKQDSLIKLQSLVVSIRAEVPKRLEILHKRINEVEQKLLEQKQYIVKLEDFSIPNDFDPLNACLNEDLKTKYDNDFIKEIKEQVRLMQIYLKKKKMEL